MVRPLSTATAALALLAVLPAPSTQAQDAVPTALEQMLAAERARTSGSGVSREPRLGDVAASGELGYVVGPRTAPAPGVYLTVWKRQRDGRFGPVLDVSTPTPAPASFASGFTAASAGRFAEYDDTTPPLATADSLLNAGLRTDQARAYEPRLAGDVRLHRPGLAPLVGARAILRWAASQPALETADTRHAEAARSGDLGFTRGDYAVRRARGREEGEYTRVWVREREGQWILALDVLQPASGTAAPR